jgi:hypothetical protein
MKTVKLIFSIFFFSLACISCQKENIEPSYGGSGATQLKAKSAKPLETSVSSLNRNTRTRFEVVVHVSNENSICNSFLVVLKDETGRSIGPAQKYVPGISVYDFFEMVSGSGKRIASFVMDPATVRIACPTELFTASAILNGKFIEGGSYTLDLYPQTNQRD